MSIQVVIPSAARDLQLFCSRELQIPRTPPPHKRGGGRLGMTNKGNRTWARLKPRSFNTSSERASPRPGRVQAKLVAASWLLCCPAECALRLLGEALKGARIVHRQVTEDFAIQFHARLFQSADELVVIQSIQAGGGANAHDPQRAVLALFLPASSVGKL